MSQLINITLPKLNATAAQHIYFDPLYIRSKILQYWLTDIDIYKRGYEDCIKHIAKNTGIWAKIKTCFGWVSPDLSPFYNYNTAVSELISLYEARQKWLMSDEFPKNICGDCPICLEPMLGQPIVLPDCLHPVCSGCFIILCSGYASYQCPMRCHIIKYVYPMTIHMSIQSDKK